MSNYQLIKKYFGTETRPVTMDELRALSAQDRAELAAQITAATPAPLEAQEGQIAA